MNRRRTMVSYTTAGLLCLAVSSSVHSAPISPQAEKVVVLHQGGAGTVVSGFVTLRNAPIKEATTVRLKWEKDGLRATFDCIDSKIVALDRQRDDAEMWKDDGVELFIDRGHTHNEASVWRHYIVSAAGGIYDESGPVLAHFSSGEASAAVRDFTSVGLKTRVARTAAGWSAEMFIPWADLGGAPRGGEVWGFNAARSNQPAGEYSCFSPTWGSFYNIGQWGHLIFDDGNKRNLARALTALEERHREVTALRDRELAMKMCWAPMMPPEKTWVEINGQIYGARADARGPLGGGSGYKALVTNGDYRISTLDELIVALGKAKAGQTIFVEGGAEIDCTVRTYVEQLVLEIPAGVTLASDRGHGESRGALIFSDTFKTSPLFKVAGPGARITGLRLRGPDPEPRLDLHNISEKLGSQKKVEGGFDHEYYYKFPTAECINTTEANLEVDNCEIAGWSHAGIYLKGGTGHRVHHNYIHHNQRNGLGYGVCLGYDKTEALIECNVFNYNRHSIAATGTPGNSYEASNNVEVEFSLSHCFDMHGGSDRQDGTDIAGTWMKIHHNYFGSIAKPVRIRGLPEQEAVIHHNWFPHHLSGGQPETGNLRTAVDTPGRTRVFDNAFGLKSPRVTDTK